MNDKSINEPSVSVVIPVFNRPEPAVNAIRSVLNQQFHDLEVIIVDDGSIPPLTLPDEISKDDRVKTIRLEKNQGPSVARNAGAKAASGKWLSWLDSDDLWHVDKLSKQMEYLENLKIETKFFALATGFEYQNPSGERKKRMPISASEPVLFFAGCWFCPGSTIILPRTIFEQVGPYDEKLFRLEDLDWFARFALQGGHLEVTPDYLVTINTGLKAPYEKVKKAGAFLLDKYRSNGWELPPAARKNMEAYLQIEYAASAIGCNRNYLHGLHHLARSWLSHPRTRLHLYKFWK